MKSLTSRQWYAKFISQTKILLNIEPNLASKWTRSANQRNIRIEKTSFKQLIQFHSQPGPITFVLIKHTHSTHEEKQVTTSKFSRYHVIHHPCLLDINLITWSFKNKYNKDWEEVQPGPTLNLQKYLVIPWGMSVWNSLMSTLMYVFFRSIIKACSNMSFETMPFFCPDFPHHHFTIISLRCSLYLSISISYMPSILLSRHTPIPSIPAAPRPFNIYLSGENVI